MKFTITWSQEGFKRAISVAVDADAGKRLAEVETIYDMLPLGHDSPNPPVSSYSRTFTKQEGITPNQPHTMQVNAKHGRHNGCWLENLERLTRPLADRPNSDSGGFASRRELVLQVYDRAALARRA